MEETNTGGVYRLWLAVMTDAVEIIKNPRFSHSSAEQFLFDESNQFFNFVAHVLEYEPESLREQIRKTVINGNPRQEPVPGRTRLPDL